MSEYISGACNIGPSEIKRRKQGALLGAILYFISVITVAATNMSPYISFIPALLFAIGYFQSKKKFCVAYGFLGIFNFEKLGNTKKISVNQDLIADRKYAVKLLFQSLLAAAVLTAAVVLIS